MPGHAESFPGRAPDSAGCSSTSQLAKHLARAGLEVRHVEREDNHAEVWVLKLRRGQVSCWPRDRMECTKQAAWFPEALRGALSEEGIVVMVQGDRIKAAFNWERGGPGWLIYSKAKAERGS